MPIVFALDWYPQKGRAECCGTLTESENSHPEQPNVGNLFFFCIGTFQNQTPILVFPAIFNPKVVSRWCCMKQLNFGTGQQDDVWRVYCYPKKTKRTGSECFVMKREIFAESWKREMWREKEQESRGSVCSFPNLIQLSSLYVDLFLLVLSLPCQKWQFGNFAMFQISWSDKNNRKNNKLTEQELLNSCRTSLTHISHGGLFSVSLFVFPVTAQKMEQSFSKGFKENDVDNGISRMISK